MVCFSGKSFRHVEKIRLHEALMKTTHHHPGFKVTSRKLCLKSAKNLCVGHRFFDEIRQHPPILLHFQAKVTESLQKSGAPGGLAHRTSLVHYAHRTDERPLGASVKLVCGVRETLTWLSICPVASRVSRAVLEKCGLQASCAY